jgi:serine beta-lactamase-like protein LACTB, mitochondrial
VSDELCMIAKRSVRCGSRFALLLLSTLAAASAPSTPAPSVPSNAIEKARALLEKEIVAKVPGLSVAVAVNGSMVWRESFGYADLANKIRVTSKTRFRIGSVSKSLASVGLALLVERGQLDLDVPIQTYIPDYPEKNAPITVRQLAGHLSGIRDYRKGEALSTTTYPDARSRLKIFEADPLIAPPGEKFSYAGYNWNVIEVAMERAARQDFAVFMESNVLGPLHLSYTRTDEPEAIDAQRTQFYEINEAGAFIFGPPIDSRHAWARGGYLSTADDLVQFGSALSHPGFLKESSLQTLFTPQTTNDGKPTEYGVGWNTHPQPKVIYHSGWTVGGLAILLMLPDSNIVVAILTNRGGLNIPEGHRLHFNIEEIGFKLARLFQS